MPRISKVELLFQKEQEVLSIRTRTKVEELPRLIGESYGMIAAYLGDLGELMAGVPFVGYHNMDMQDLDVEIGFPVARPLMEKGEIKPSVIPAGRVVFSMFRGAYGEMEPLYEEMTEFIVKNGLEAAGMVYEYYYNGLDFPESEYLTKIIIPVK